MAFSISKGRISPIAIDFGADALKLLQVIPSDPPRLVAAATVELPEHARKGPAERRAFYTESLKVLLKSQPFRGRKAICSIPSYQTLVQHFQIPRYENDKTVEQVGVQLRERLNVDPNRMVMRIHSVGSVARDTSKQEVICFATSKEAVMAHIECAHRAKLDVVGMQCEPLAIIKSFGHLFTEPGHEDQTTCFIDIGAATTKVTISHGTKMVFAKAIHAAGDHFNRHRASSDGASFTDARQLRIQEAIDGTEEAHTIVARARGVPRAQSADAGEETAGLRDSGESVWGLRMFEDETVADTLDCLIDELQIYMRYHQTMYPERAVDKLVFVGGEANHVKNCQSIARALRTKAQLGDPLSRMVKPRRIRGPHSIDAEVSQPGWAVPYGLCLNEGNA